MADYALQFTQTDTAVSVPLLVNNPGNFVEMILGSGNEGTEATNRYLFGQSQSTNGISGFGLLFKSDGSGMILRHNSTETTPIIPVDGMKVRVDVVSDGVELTIDDVFYEKITNAAIDLSSVVANYFGAWDFTPNFGSTFKLKSFNLNGEQFDCNEGTGTTVIGDSSTVGTFINAVTWYELPAATTTVEVEWIDSISAAATGNKIYRDDIEIADIANGVQIYQDATAETGTEYKYEVQAYSATDETTQEVLGVNVQYITTA